MNSSILFCLVGAFFFGFYLGMTISGFKEDERTDVVYTNKPCRRCVNPRCTKDKCKKYD